MSKMKNVYTILEDWGIENPTEQDVWDAVAELDGHQRDYYADDDLAAWL